MSSKRTVTTVPGLSIADLLNRQMRPAPPEGEGWQSAAEIVEDMGGNVSQQAVRRAMKQLVQQGKAEEETFLSRTGTHYASYFRVKP
jgi:hypothetical protein